MSDKQGWNQPRGSTASGANVESGRRRRRIVWATLCVSTAIVAFYVAKHLGEGSGDGTQADDEKNRRIAEATPSKPSPVQEVADEKPEKPKEVITNFVNNVWRDDKGRPHYKVARTIRPGQKTVINGKPWVPEKPIFHHASEVELDVLLSRKPGERIFGEVNWNAFKKDLPTALVEKIEILPDDTPEIIERKQAVMDAKNELIAAIKAGEDPVEILKSSRDEVNKLADIRDNLLSTVAELKQQGASEEEIEDAVSAANAMLKEYNIDKPIVSPRTMRERAAAAKARKPKDKTGR